MPAPERRSARRIHLTAPIDASLGATGVKLIEISPRGALVEHATPFVEGARLRLTFRWEGSSISRDCRVVRSKLTRGHAGQVVYRSGLEFAKTPARR
jgi:hypothetical protein